MRSSILVMPFLLHLLLANFTKGLCLDEKLVDKRASNEKRAFGGDNGDAVAFLCNDPRLCSVKSRKLMTTKQMPLSKSTINGETKHNSAKDVGVVESMKQKHGHTSEQAYPDVLDIAGMDYSPAKRKPPIHN